MRTTIRIDDDLYRRAKADAARRGQTVGELIEDALRLALRRPGGTTREIPELPTFGGSGTMPGVDLADSRSLRDLMDADRDFDALR
ncbi:ribbon-helix-helix protein, CopG family [Rhabdothermincola sediminis]|uniref:ribbon-helix-helix protein, CopG family n=1 Tax=Rhabdothermincola sediminis TaxID=2751370 RepID=UPI001AA0213A|nr:ribbon-helix-helix protein, CopG family [Rhabdothermincola sediminis]